MSLPIEDSPAFLLRKHLIAVGKGSDLSAGGEWPITVENELDNPDEVLTLYDTTPVPQGRSNFGEVWQNPSFQLRIRAKDYSTGYNKSQSLLTYLSEEVVNVPITVETRSYILYCLTRFNGPLPLRKQPQAKGRDLFTMNFTASLRRIS